MKRFKFLIVVLGLIATQGVFAVTLPTTSYTEYTSPTGGYDDNSISGVGLPSSPFMQLGTISYDECTSMATFQLCEQCCSNKVRDCYSDPTVTDKSECNTLSSECNNGCGRSLPLDAPLWFMLALAALGAVVTLSVVQRSEESRNMR